MDDTLLYTSRDLKGPPNVHNFRFHSTNPSNQHRLRNYAIPGHLAPFYNQNILTDNPSNVIYYSGTTGISSNPRIQLPNTGEYFNFLESETDVYRDVVNTTLGVSRVSSPLDLDNDKPGKPICEPPSLKYDVSLFDSIKNKLNGLQLKDHPCDVCAKNGYKSMFNNDNQLLRDLVGSEFVEPCPHSAFKNVPVIHSMSVFDEARDDTNTAYHTPDSKVPDIVKFTDAVNFKDAKVPNLENSGAKKLNIDEVNVDHLLTYNHKRAKLVPQNSKEVEDISEFVETTTNLNSLAPIQTNSLREFALKVDNQPESAETCLTASPFEGLSANDVPIVTLRESEVDQRRLDLWRYPKCFMKDSEATHALPTERKALDRTHSVKEDDDTFKEIQEYLRNNDMSVDFMMEKYVNLRKSNCSKEALKALKHLICLKLNKQKLYFKGTELKTLDKNSQESLFDKVLSNISKANPLKDDDFAGDDDSTLYTYSSLSLSTYDSIMENLTFGVTDNDFCYENPDSVHADVLDAYGWLTVLDEGSRRSHHKILYCELMGNRFSLYSASYKANYKSINSNKSVMSIQLDEFFTIIRKKDPEKNKVYIRLHGTQLKPKDDTSPATRSPSGRRDVAKDDGTVFLRVEADTQNELLNWFTFLSSRSKIRSFFTVLEDFRVAPLNHTLHFLLYPKRKELIFNRLSYISECEEQVYKMFIKHPFHYIDFSMRNMTDVEFLHHVSVWTQPVFTVNFSLNRLNFAFEPNIMVDYVKNNSIQRMYLDKNPLDERFYTTVLVPLAVNTGLKYISFRGCKIYESLVSVLKKITKTKELGVLVLDFRECETDSEFESFATGYPLKTIKVIIENSVSYVQEYEMEYFMDTKSLPEITVLGSLISGRLLSMQWRVRKTFNWPFSKRRNDDAVDVYFEFRAPYLVWHNWFPKNKRFVFTRRGKQTEEASKLTESQAVFVKDVKIVPKEGTNWLLIQGKAPEKFKAASKGKDVKIVVKGYTDNATQRWFEILNRWVAGVTYVEYLHAHPTTLASKHILSFCSRIDSPELVMNGFPAERKIMMRFLSHLSGQKSLKTLNFSNMGLDVGKLAFDRPVLKDLELARLDFSFNLIELEVENMWLLNALLPKITVNHYNISRNPLGDNLNSSKLFFRVLALSPQKISFNFCKLSNVFLTRLTGALLKYTGTFESLKIIELEGNEFGFEETEKFVDVLVQRFPNLIDLRLDGSIAEEHIKKLVDLNPICNFERISKDEPEVGDFTRVLHVKKEKQTTRQSVLLNRKNLSTQFE